jgi:hypothetical protein
MRRAPLLAAALLVAGCGTAAESGTVSLAGPAEPQRFELGWREAYPAARERLVFQVASLAVTANGWSADIAVTNSTKIPFELRDRGSLLDYGLMLFATGDLDELEERARNGVLPALRRARRIEPAPPLVLPPGATWRARLSAPGALADGSWARVSFGPLRARGEPPEAIEPVVVWITDHAQRL